jgi:hypothetical protein
MGATILITFLLHIEYLRGNSRYAHYKSVIARLSIDDMGIVDVSGDYGSLFPVGLLVCKFYFRKAGS